MFARVILLIALAALPLVGIVRANDAPKLPGSALTIPDAVSKCDAAFVGAITKIPPKVMLPSTAPYAGPLYNGVRVKVTEVLRGLVSKQVSITLFVDFTLQEQEPAVGKRYVFFVSKNGKIDSDNPDPFTVLKLLPLRADYVVLVKELVAQLPTK
jgi:hypothetical protein